MDTAVYINEEEKTCIYKLPWGTSIQNYSEERIREFVVENGCRIYYCFNEFVNECNIDEYDHRFAASFNER